MVVKCTTITTSNIHIMEEPTEEGAITLAVQLEVHLTTTKRRIRVTLILKMSNIINKDNNNILKSMILGRRKLEQILKFQHPPTGPKDMGRKTIAPLNRITTVDTKRIKAITHLSHITMERTIVATSNHIIAIKATRWPTRQEEVVVT